MMANGAEDRTPRSGEPAAFLTELLRQFRPPVFHFVYRMVQNRDMAEQLAEDVLMEAWRKRSALEGKGARIPVFRLAWQRTIQAARERAMRRAGLTAAAPEAQDGPPADTDGVVAIRRSLLKLPLLQRAAIILHTYHGMNASEVAQVLDCPESLVHPLLFRAYEAMAVTMPNGRGLPFLRAIAVGQAVPGRTI